MKITCTSTFLDGRDRFEAGETRVVDDDRGRYFIAQGWATDGAAPPAGAAADPAALTIATAQHGQGAHHG